MSGTARSIAAPVVIRRAILTDKAEWLRLRRRLWPEADSENLASELDSMLQDEDAPVFVAERGDAGLCGLLEAGMRRYADGCDSSPVGYIEGWYVDDDIRGSGVGAALLAEAEDWARERGFKEMASDTGITNEASRMAHVALGYHETERLIHFSKTL
jgi:aminoglycoside 6'-N-acetyltransferase I